jgi:hypothetical protein
MFRGHKTCQKTPKIRYFRPFRLGSSSPSPLQLGVLRGIQTVRIGVIRVRMKPKFRYFVEKSLNRALKLGCRVRHMVTNFRLVKISLSWAPFDPLRRCGSRGHGLNCVHMEPLFLFSQKQKLRGVLSSVRNFSRFQQPCSPETLTMCGPSCRSRTLCTQEM